jgi:hypothetical protein
MVRAFFLLGVAARFWMFFGSFAADNFGVVE